MKPVEVNEAFRQWTSGQSFALVMGRAQVAVLVCIHASLDRKDRVGAGHPRLKHWLTGIRGLEERGLVIHTQDSIPKKRWMNQDYLIGECWKITEAGLHVVELLRIVGTYGELLKEFERADVRRRKEQMASGWK